MQLLWIQQYIIVAEPGKGLKDIPGVIRMMERIANAKAG